MLFKIVQGQVHVFFRVVVVPVGGVNLQLVFKSQFFELLRCLVRLGHRHHPVGPAVDDQAGNALKELNGPGPADPRNTGNGPGR